MEKTKLAICIEDQEYRERFVKCLMNHYKESFEIHVLNEIQKEHMAEKRDFEVIITGDGKEISQYLSRESSLLVLQENGVQEQDESQENIHYIAKYQEVYKIMDVVEKISAGKDHFMNKRVESERQEKIGVFSLGKEMMQVPFCALLAEILGEHHRVLVMNMQPFSGLATEIEIEDVLGMEDVMSIATTQNYTRNRLAGSIGHEQKWDFIYPTKNSFCLMEGGDKLYQNIMAIFQKEFGYDYIVVNVSTVISDMVELLESCQQIYFLTDKQEERNWRESNFLMEMQYQGKEDILQKITWIEIPAEVVKERSWHQLAKSWLWSELGDKLRVQYWMEKENGTGV